MQQLEQAITEWHTSTFPNCTFESQIKKFEEERIEMEKADCYRDYINELSDCYIATLALARYNDTGNIIKDIFIKYINNIRKEHTSWFIDKYAIIGFIKDKLEVNKQRRWEFDVEKGGYRHVKE